MSLSMKMGTGRPFAISRHVSDRALVLTTYRVLIGCVLGLAHMYQTLADLLGTMAP